MDVLRSIQKEGTLEPLLKNITHRINNIDLPELEELKNKVLSGLKNITKFVKTAPSKDFWETSARSFSYSLFRVFSASLLIDHAQYALKEEDNSFYLYIAKRFCQQDLTPLIFPDKQHINESSFLVFGK